MNVLTKFSQEVADITKSLEFTQKELHDSLAGVKNDMKNVQTDPREIEDDHLEILLRLDDKAFSILVLKNLYIKNILVLSSLTYIV